MIYLLHCLQENVYMMVYIVAKQDSLLEKKKNLLGLFLLLC